MFPYGNIGWIKVKERTKSNTPQDSGDKIWRSKHQARQDCRGRREGTDLVAMFKAAKALRTDMRQCIVLESGDGMSPDLVAMFKAVKALWTDMRQCIVLESGDGHILAQGAHRAEKSRNTFVESSRLKQQTPFLSPSRISSVSQSPYLRSTVRSTESESMLAG